MVDIANRDTVVADVVPDAEHSSMNLWVALGELFLAYLSRRPSLIEVLAVEVVIVIACSRDDINISVGYGYHVVSQLVHIMWVGIAVVPHVHHHILYLDGCVALGMGKLPPKYCRFTIAFNLANEMIN